MIIRFNVQLPQKTILTLIRLTLRMRRIRASADVTRTETRVAFVEIRACATRSQTDH